MLLLKSIREVQFVFGVIPVELSAHARGDTERMVAALAILVVVAKWARTASCGRDYFTSTGEGVSTSSLTCRMLH